MKLLPRIGTSPDRDKHLANGMSENFTSFISVASSPLSDEREAYPIMDRILARWRKVPYLHSSLIWTLAILLLGDWIGGSYFQSDFRLRYAFMCIAVSAVYFVHVLIYKRKSPADVRVSLTIFIPVISLSVWLSFALFTAESSFNFLPLLVGMFTAFGLDLWFQRRQRQS